MTQKSELEVSELRQIAGWLESAGVGFIEIGRGRNIARLTLELPVRRASPRPVEAPDGNARETRTNQVVARHAGVFLTTHPARSAPLVEIGSRVRAGDTVALLQIAELCLPVVAPADGEAEEWLVEPGTIVGYGTALMVLKSLAHTQYNRNGVTTCKST
ncbi:acetyl-CoA carboxylase biotin carboxyl carrier protein subunit [Caballeronia choica]|uniref:Acetyl-CoA carboxylase biotin carboxyl carrier protein subunit n=1 Tax=Caballeronia choica TaxID=326476 RepID=A0A158KW05_9BURK|nr:biotin/lipoyl-containing protein [Caballeronia choica]SAL84601.1 acetyl-CoA carboxylase biotin carboxyl carrier protein subunit [Caballeronia choica]